MRLYEYLFFWVYSWNLKRRQTKDMAKWNGVFAVSMVMSANFLLVQFGARCFGLILFFKDLLPNSEIVIMMTITLTIGYFLFGYNKKEEKIYQKYANEPSRKKVLKGFGLTLYIIFSFILPIYLIRVIANKELSY